MNDKSIYLSLGDDLDDFICLLSKIQELLSRDDKVTIARTGTSRSEYDDEGIVIRFTYKGEDIAIFYERDGVIYVKKGSDNEVMFDAHGDKYYNRAFRYISGKF